MAAKRTKAQKRKDIFMSLREQSDEVIKILPNKQSVYICRACPETTNKPLVSEQEWFRHLQSRPHQQRHIGFDFRQYLWDVERTVLINECLGLLPEDIMAYISQARCKLNDFSYITQKPGSLNNCYALVSSESEAKQLTSVIGLWKTCVVGATINCFRALQRPIAHYIGKEKRKCLFTLLEERGKDNCQKARERFLETCLGNNGANANNVSKKRKLE